MALTLLYPQALATSLMDRSVAWSSTTASIIRETVQEAIEMQIRLVAQRAGDMAVSDADE